MISLVGFGSAITDYAVATKNKAQLGKTVNKQPEVSANVAYYQANIGNVESVDDLLKNRKLLTVALGAYGLESQVDAKGLLRKLLTEDPAASTSLARKTSNTRYLAFAQAFAGLSTDGGASIRDAKNVAAVVANYQQMQYEKAIGQTDTAAQQAIYFNRVAPQATQSIYQVLADKTLSAVVRGAYGLPLATAALTPAQQASQLKAKGFDYTKLSDPKYVQGIIDKFLAKSDAAGPPTGSAADEAATGLGAAAVTILNSVAASAAGNNGVAQIDLSFLGSGGKFNVLV
jgi:hypothetical protein